MLWQKEQNGIISKVTKQYFYRKELAMHGEWFDLQCSHDFDNTTVSWEKGPNYVMAKRTKLYHLKMN